jgi:acid stress-induced BolA-like protein IbaG/YrbA
MTKDEQLVNQQLQETKHYIINKVDDFLQYAFNLMSQAKPEEWKQRLQEFRNALSSEQIVNLALLYKEITPKDLIKNCLVNYYPDATAILVDELGNDKIYWITIIDECFEGLSSRERQDQVLDKIKNFSNDVKYNINISRLETPVEVERRITTHNATHALIKVFGIREGENVRKFISKKLTNFFTDQQTKVTSKNLNPEALPVIINDHNLFIQKSATMWPELEEREKQWDNIIAAFHCPTIAQELRQKLQMNTTNVTEEEPQPYIVETKN